MVYINIHVYIYIYMVQCHRPQHLHASSCLMGKKYTYAFTEFTLLDLLWLWFLEYSYLVNVFS